MPQYSAMAISLYICSRYPVPYPITKMPPSRTCQRRVFVEIPTRRRPYIPVSAPTNNSRRPVPCRTTEEIFRATFPDGIDAWTIDCYSHRGATSPDRRTIPSVVEDYMKDPVSCRIWVIKVSIFLFSQLPLSLSDCDLQPKKNQHTYTLCLTIHMRIICHDQVICNTISPRITLATYTGSQKGTLAPRWLHIATPGFNFYRNPDTMLSVAGTGAACDSDVLRATGILLWRSRFWVRHAISIARHGLTLILFQSRKNQIRNKISRLLKCQNSDTTTQNTMFVSLPEQNKPNSSFSTNHISRVRRLNQWQKIRSDS